MNRVQYTQPSTKAQAMLDRKRQKKQKREDDKQRRQAGRELLQQRKDARRAHAQRRSDRLSPRRSAAGRGRGGAFGTEAAYMDDVRECFVSPDVDAAVAQLAARRGCGGDGAQTRPPPEVALADIMRPARARGGRRNEGALLTDGQTFEMIDVELWYRDWEGDGLPDVDADEWEVLSEKHLVA